MDYIALKDCCRKIGSGATPKGGARVYVEEGISLIRSQNVRNLQFVEKGLARITKEASDKLKNVIVEKNDVLLNITGDSVARVCLVPDDILPARVNQHVAIIRTDDQKLNPFYLAYYLASPQMQNYMLNIASGKGASRNALTKDLINRFLIPVPDRTIQDKVVYILSKYDQLIKNNNKRINLLEQTAQEIYKEWFVRFRFPGYEKIKKKTSSIGKIPETFNVVKMNEVILDNIGGGWGEEDYSEQYPQEGYVIRGADFPYVSKGDMSSCPFRYHKQSNYDARQLKENDIVIEISGGTQEQPVGRTVLITKGMLDKLENKVICASFCKRITLNKDIVSPYFFYYWTQFLYDTRMIDRFQLQSTGIINFKFEYFLKKGDCLLPPKSLMNDFESEVKSIKKQIDLLAFENTNLIKQRNFLLPRLMSGELEV